MRHREQPLPPSQFGFATQPQFHREAKSAMLNREQREMTRINGGIAPSSTSQADPLRVDPRSAIFSGPESRLEKMSSEKFLKRSQSQKHEHKKERLEKLKEERLDRDARRIQAMADELIQWDEDSKKLAGTGMKNRSSVGYNVVDGAWRDSSAAARAKYHDDMVKYYAECRTQKLDQKTNCSYNILNGQDRMVVTRNEIPRPEPPEDVREALNQAKTSQEQQKKLRDRPRYELSPAAANNNSAANAAAGKGNNHTSSNNNSGRNSLNNSLRSASVTKIVK